MLGENEDYSTVIRTRPKKDENKTAEHLGMGKGETAGDRLRKPLTSMRIGTARASRY